MAPADFLTPTAASLPGPANVTAIHSLLQVGETEASRTNRCASQYPALLHLSNQILHLDFFFPPQLVCLSNFS